MFLRVFSMQEFKLRLDNDPLYLYDGANRPILLRSLSCAPADTDPSSARHAPDNKDQVSARRTPGNKDQVSARCAPDNKDQVSAGLSELDLAICDRFAAICARQEDWDKQLQLALVQCPGFTQTVADLGAWLDAVEAELGERSSPLIGADDDAHSRRQKYDALLVSNNVYRSISILQLKSSTMKIRIAILRK